MDINEHIRRLSNDESILDSQTTPEFKSTAENGQWVGKVVDNDDPLHLGRCKIRVFGYFDDIEAKALPWAMCQTSYVGSTYGNLIVPEVGSVVTGYFDNGDTMKPVYTGTFNQVDNLLKAPSRVSRLNDYPNTMILLETDQGETLTLNRSNGKIVFTHRSGTTITIGANGSVDISQPTTSSNIKDSTPAKLTVNIGNTADIVVQGDATIESKMNVNVKAGGEILLGNNLAKQLVNCLPVCLVTGAPHNGQNVQVKA